MGTNRNNRIKVLGMCYEDPEVLIGGMGRHVGELYRAMARRRDVEIDFLTTGPDTGPKMHDGYMKHYTDKLVAYKPVSADLVSHLTMDVQALRTLLQIMALGKQWDVVHVHDWNCIQIGRAVRDALHIPMVGTMHLCLTHLMEEGGVYNHRPTQDEIYTMQMEGHLAVDTDRFILCSSAFQKIVSNIFMLRRHVDMIPNGIDLGEWRPDIMKRQLPFDLPDRPIALFVGRIADMKGIRVLLDAVEDADTGFCIVLSGDVNADTDEIKEGWDVTVRIRELQAKYPERLQWVGFNTDETLKQLYLHSTVGIMPSVHEPFGIVALEFMAMGVPLICTEADGLGEVVIDGHGKEYALIIPAGCPTAINMALEMCKEPDVCLELRELGLERVNHFNWDLVADATVNVYREAINDRINYSNRSEEYHEAESTGR